MEKSIFCIPIVGLQLTKATKYEFTINRVLFVNKKKLPYIRKRLHLSIPLSRYPSSSKTIIKKFFSIADTYALLHVSGNYRSIDRSIEKNCFKLVKDELSLLSLSQLGYSKRRYNSRLNIFSSQKLGLIEHIFLDKSSVGFSHGREGANNPDPLIINHLWLNYHRKLFYLKLLKILKGNININKNWLKTLRRASILAGESQNTMDLAQAFLWNMISIETLLTKQGDSYYDIIPERMEALLGWCSIWSNQGYSDKIRKLYRKRCKFVHDGNKDSILVDDLLLSDDLLLNLFQNIVYHINIFQSKEFLIEFTKKCAAEKKLGIKSRTRPKTLRFISRKYTEDDLKNI